MIINGPCQGCADRYVGCHSKCELYISFRKELDEEKAKEIRARSKEEPFVLIEKERTRRIARKKR